MTFSKNAYIIEKEIINVYPLFWNNNIIFLIVNCKAKFPSNKYTWDYIYVYGSILAYNYNYSIIEKRICQRKQSSSFSIFPLYLFIINFLIISINTETVFYHHTPWPWKHWLTAVLCSIPMLWDFTHLIVVSYTFPYALVYVYSSSENPGNPRIMWSTAAWYGPRHEYWHIFRYFYANDFYLYDRLSNRRSASVYFSGEACLFVYLSKWWRRELIPRGRDLVIAYVAITSLNNKLPCIQYFCKLSNY